MSFNQWFDVTVTGNRMPSLIFKLGGLSCKVLFKNEENAFTLIKSWNINCVCSK